MTQRALRARRSLPLPPLVIGMGPLPFPVRLTEYVGQPIWPQTKPQYVDEPEAIAEIDERVRSAIEELLQNR